MATSDSVGKFGGIVTQNPNPLSKDRVTQPLEFKDSHAYLSMCLNTGVVTVEALSPDSLNAQDTRTDRVHWNFPTEATTQQIKRFIAHPDTQKALRNVWDASREIPFPYLYLSEEKDLVHDLIDNYTWG